MKSRFFLIPALILLTACGSSRLPVRNYYLLDYSPIIDRDDLPPKPYPIKVRLTKFTLPKIYDKGNKLVFRSSQYQLRYYAREIWVARPNVLIGEVVEKHIAAYKLFEQFGENFVDNADYEIAGEVNAIERYQVGEFGGAHLAMTLRFLRSSDFAVLVEHKFDTIEELYNEDTSSLIKEYGSVIEEQTDIFIGKIRAWLETEYPQTQ